MQHDMQKINNAFIAIGYTKISASSGYYWTSTQADSDDAWALYLSGSTIRIGSTSKMSEYYVRPVCSL